MLFVGRLVDDDDSGYCAKISMFSTFCLFVAFVGLHVCGRQQTTMNDNTETHLM